MTIYIAVFDDAWKAAIEIVKTEFSFWKRVEGRRSLTTLFQDSHMGSWAVFDANVTLALWQQSVVGQLGSLGWQSFMTL